MRQVEPTDSNQEFRLIYNEAMEEIERRLALLEPKSKKTTEKEYSSWSQSQPQNPSPTDWEPVEGHPGYFKSPGSGVWMSVAKGEVPQAIIERFAEKAEEPEVEEPSE